eukprot:8452671-Ditylum_brightwellii.AAC.1
MKMLPLVIHHSKDSLATIPSFKAVSALPSVEGFYHNRISNIVYIRLPDKKVLQFISCKNGLYFLDSTPAKLNNNLPTDLPQSYSLLSTAKSKSFGLGQKFEEQMLLGNYRNT